MLQAQNPLREYLFRENRRLHARNTALQFREDKNMLTKETFEKTLNLLDEGSNHYSIKEETGITSEDTSAVRDAWCNGNTDQLFREVQLADVLELAAATLCSGEGWEEGTAGDVLREILHVYREHAKKALGLALLSGKL
jgi:hypothetical protein